MTVVMFAYLLCACINFLPGSYYNAIGESEWMREKMMHPFAVAMEIRKDTLEYTITKTENFTIVC